MAENYKYILVGGGLASASAISGIREIDREGSILLIGQEEYLPYDRPPLTKRLWTGQKKVDEIFVHGEDFYKKNNVEILKGRKATALDAKGKRIGLDNGNEYAFEKLLLATGGTPRKLPIPGGELDGISYYRYLDDYLYIRSKAKPGSSAAIIGGGFIGSELTAALNLNQVQVTMIFPEPYIVDRVFPEYLGRAIQEKYLERGVKILHDRPASFEKSDGRFLVRTEGGNELYADMVVAGIGIKPNMELAQMTGLRTGNGIIVDSYLRSSDPDIFAAGDNAFFPYSAIGKDTRVEHWDNAIAQGKLAGRNMAGANERYDYMPYFFSDLFEFGYEAVGEVDARLQTFADWEKENEKGTIYYLRDGIAAGVMTCNIYGKMDAARELIKKGVMVENLTGAIR